MAYSRQSHDLLEDKLTEMVSHYGQSTAYARMLGYLLVNVALEDAERIARVATDEMEGKKND